MTKQAHAVLCAVAIVTFSGPALADEPPPPAKTPEAPATATPPPTAPAPPAPPAAQAPTAPQAPPAPAAVQPTPAGAAAPTPTPPAEPVDEDNEMHFTATRPTDMQSFAEQSAKETRIVGQKTRFSLNFFGDTYASIIGGRDTVTKTSFGVGSFSFLFFAELGNNIRATAEPAIEFDENNTPGIDLERMHLRYTTHGFWVEAGRSHIDLGYWNTAYHHGKWLQPTIERPRIVHFEDDNGILPIHFIGAQVGYTIPLGGNVTLTPSVAVGNGRGAIVDDVQSGVDKRPEKQGYSKLELKGLGHRDLRIGVSGVYGKISSQDATVRPALPDTTMGEMIGNAYVAFPSDPFLAIAEGYVISHSGPDRTWETYAAFAVLGYSIPPVTPYVKVERIVMTNGLDPFFVPDPTKEIPALDLYEGIIGARIDVASWSAVKAEYRYERVNRDGWGTIHEGIVSWQFGI